MTNAEANASRRRMPVLLTGASGYIGGRLVPRLLAAGHRVRCLAREPRKLDSRPRIRDPDVEVVRCDVSDRQTLADTATKLNSTTKGA